MFSLLSGLWRYIFHKDEYYVLLLGLDNAGKSVSSLFNILCKRRRKMSFYVCICVRRDEWGFVVGVGVVDGGTFILLIYFIPNIYVFVLLLYILILIIIIVLNKCRHYSRNLNR